MKAIIQIAPRGGIFKAARADLKRGGSGDYVLTFESARVLFSELTAARIMALEHLREFGPLSIYGLAKGLGRNYSNVHGDAQKLLELGLAKKDAKRRLLVPWDAVEIRLDLAKAA